MEWAEGPTELLIQQMNRLQNTNDVWLVDPKTGPAAQDVPRRGQGVARRRRLMAVASGRQEPPLGQRARRLAPRVGDPAWRGRAAPAHARSLRHPDDLGRGREGGPPLLHRLAGRRRAALPLPRAPRRQGGARARHARQSARNAFLRHRARRPLRAPHLLDRRPAARRRPRPAPRAPEPARARVQRRARPPRWRRS